MKFLNFEIKKIEKRNLDKFTDNDSSQGILNYINSSYSTYSDTKAMKISSVYRCVNVIANAVASLKIIPYIYKSDPNNWLEINYDNNIWNLLNIQPNPYQSAFNFKKQIIYEKLLKGNAYIYVDADSSWNIKNYYILDANNIEIKIINNNIIYYDKVSKKSYDKSQIIHLFDYSEDGLNGLSVLTQASISLGIAYNQEKLADNWNKGGGNPAGILTAEGNLPPDKIKEAKDSFLNSFTDVYGEVNGMKVVGMGGGFKFQPISFNPKEMQLLESRTYNIIDVCRWFGVPPSMVFDQNGKYATNEQQQLDFLNNCLQPTLEQIENEFFRKSYLKKDYYMNELFFDTENITRLDSQARADFFVKLFNVGAYTTNEIREKLRMNKPLKGGNEAFIQQLQMLSNPVQKDNIDNQLKTENKSSEEINELRKKIELLEKIISKDEESK